MPGISVASFLYLNRLPESDLVRLVRNLSDPCLRQTCYDFQLGGFNSLTSIVFDELKRRGGLCLQFYNYYNHRFFDMTNSQMAGKRICTHPKKNGECYAPLEFDERFIEAFKLEVKYVGN